MNNQQQFKKGEVGGKLLHTMTKGVGFGSLGNKQELMEWVSAAVLAGTGLVLGREEGQAEGQAVSSAPSFIKRCKHSSTVLRPRAPSVRSWP